MSRTDATTWRDHNKQRLGVALAALAVVVVSGDPVALGRAVVNLPVSAVAVAWAKAHGGHCRLNDDLTVACSDMTGGYANGGTTVGNVWLYGQLGGSDRQRHETRHSDQWAMFDGGPVFPLVYGTESVRTDGDLLNNVYERWAGLHDGGYE